MSTIIVKRLADAIRDRDPIRAVILGTSSNSNGRTAGIASPSSSAQAAAIRAAYSNAGITDLNQTTYLEVRINSAFFLFLLFLKMGVKLIPSLNSVMVQGHKQETPLKLMELARFSHPGVRRTDHCLLDRYLTAF